VSALKVRVDTARCIGAGQCVLRAPQAFDQQENGIVILLEASPSPELHAAVREAADQCPAQAIIIEEA
jgi:ferredoxin